MSLNKSVLWLKTSFKKVLQLRASAHEIALGMAIGIFIGIFSTFGLGGLVILAIAPLLRLPMD